MSPAHLARLQAAHQSRLDLLHVLAPDGRCRMCNRRPRRGLGALEVDHVNGRDWAPRDLPMHQRIARYWQEYRDGVKLRALCRRCNAKDGAHRRGRAAPWLVVRRAA